MMINIITFHFKSSPEPPPSPYLVRIQDSQFTGTFDLIPNVFEVTGENYPIHDKMREKG